MFTNTSVLQYLRQNKNTAFCRLGGTQTEPNICVGFRFTSPNLQENGEGIAKNFLTCCLLHACLLPQGANYLARLKLDFSSVGCAARYELQ